MPIVTKEANVVRYFVHEDFNPSSPKQLLALIKSKGLSPGYNKKTESETTDEDTLKRLAKADPFFKKILRWREITKIKSTYVDPYIARADEEARIHAQFLHAPSTMRLSSQGPNLQNVPRDDDELESIEREFRHCIVASPGCLLVEADANAIEAVLTGHFMGDPDYMRLATMGIHSFVLAALLNKPADKNWEDAKLAAYLKDIKRTYKESPQYYGCKRGVHLTNYGGSPSMMVIAEPEVFTSKAYAAKIQNLYLELCPKLAPWQKACRDRAHKEHALGGGDHPFYYRHWFWDVYAWDPRYKTWKPGSDYNRVVAFYPQSTAAGIQFENCLRLTDPESPYYIGDYYYGRTPLRALIHDSILGEVPVERLDDYVARVRACMELPIPQLGGLVIKCDIKVGRDWGSMKPMKEAA